MTEPKVGLFLQFNVGSRGSYQFSDIVSQIVRETKKHWVTKSDHKFRKSDMHVVGYNSYNAKVLTVKEHASQAGQKAEFEEYRRTVDDLLCNIDEWGNRERRSLGISMWGNQEPKMTHQQCLERKLLVDDILKKVDALVLLSKEDKA